MDGNRGPVIILASQSAGRRRMLENAGVPFRAEPADIDEEAVRRTLASRSASIEEVASTLARKKAEAVSALQPGSLVLGADQMLECEGRRFDKPADIAEARRHLQFLQGRTHSLVTAAVLASDGERLWSHTEVCRLTMRSLSCECLEAYLDEVGERVLESVGCYQIEGRGVRLFERIEGDWHAIIGLPLVAVLNELGARGVLEP